MALVMALVIRTGVSLGKYLFNKYPLNTHHTPSTIVDNGETAVNKIYRSSYPHGAFILVEEVSG